MCRCRAKGRAANTVLTCGILHLIIEMGVFTLGYLRMTYPLYQFYLGYRIWGFWGVQGSGGYSNWFEYSEQMCTRWQRWNWFFVACKSPLCNWYLLKCNTYFWWALWSYFTGSMFVAAMCLSLRGLFWTMSFTPRELRFAFYATLIACLLHLVSIMTFDMSFDDMHSAPNLVAHYAPPPTGYGYFGLIIAIGVLWGRIYFQGFLYAKARQFEQEESSSSSGDDEDEAKRLAKILKGRGKKGKGKKGKGKKGKPPHKGAAPDDAGHFHDGDYDGGHQGENYAFGSEYDY